MTIPTPAVFAKLQKPLEKPEPAREAEIDSQIKNLEEKLNAKSREKSESLPRRSKKKDKVSGKSTSGQKIGIKKVYERKAHLYQKPFVTQELENLKRELVKSQHPANGRSTRSSSSGK